MKKTYVLLMFWMFLWAWNSGVLAGYFQEGDQAIECPVNHVAIAKYHPQDYDGQDFESGFEYGAEIIDIVSMYWGGKPEVYEVTWLVQWDNDHTPISAAFMKAGLDGELYIYDPPKTVKTPPEAITIQSDMYGISHITWCTPAEPTAITLTSFQADGASGVGTALFLLVVGIVVTLLVLVTMIVVRTWRR